MQRFEMTRAAVMDLMRGRGLQPEQTMSLFEIGIPLTPQGYTVSELVDALYALEGEGMIRLMGGDRLQLQQPLSPS